MKIKKLLNTRILLIIGTVSFLVFFILLPQINENRVEKEKLERQKIDNLTSCIEQEYRDSLRKYYQLCGLDHDECPLISAITASMESEYLDRKKECLDNYYSR